MSIYKIIKFSLLFASTALVACSDDKSETRSTEIPSVIEQHNPDQTSNDSHGLHVYKDPKTGEFLDGPPPVDPNAPAVANNVVGKKTLLVPQYSDPKATTVEGGGSSIDVTNPSVEGKVFTRRSK